jgi:hypothetical protein
MFYALPSKILVTHGAMVDAQRVKRPVLIAQSTPVAVQGEPGVALGGPLRRADVAFVSVASVHGVPAKTSLTRSNQFVSCQAPTCRTAPCRPCGACPCLDEPHRVKPGPTVPRQIRPNTAVSRPTEPGRTGSYRIAPGPAHSPLRAYPCLVAPKQAEPERALPVHALPQTAEHRLAKTCRIKSCPAWPHRPYGRIPAMSNRTEPNLIRPRLAWFKPHSARSNRTGPCHIALAGVSLSRHADVSPIKPHSTEPCRAWPCLVKPGPTRACSPLWGVSLPRRTLPRRAAPRQALFCRTLPSRILPQRDRPYRAAPCRAAPCRPYGRIPAQPERARSYRAVPYLTESWPAATGPTQANLVALAGVSMPCRAGSCRTAPDLVLPSLAEPNTAIPCRPCGRIHTLTNHASSRRAVSCLARPNLAVPCRDQHRVERKNPNTCALVGLLKTHGGCTDVRIVDHEPQQNSPRDVSLQQFQYTRNGRPCQQGVACERT